MKKSWASYYYKTGLFEGKPYISIIDNDGIKSVTNDIENVVADICKAEGIEAEDHIVVYRDSEGNWDGWRTVSETFIVFSASSEEEALKLFIQSLTQNN